MKKRLRYLVRIAAVCFVLLNISAAFHAWHFTHFSEDDTPKTKLDELSFSDKVSLVCFGLSNPRPKTKSLPAQDYERLQIASGNEMLEAWYMPADSISFGDVILFHGFSGEKSSMLERATYLRSIGYGTLLIDFRGSGGSTGNITTIGFEEAGDVKATVDFIHERGADKIILFGTSMGAAAILKAVAEQGVRADQLILECPFASMLQTAKNRFEKLGAPAFPAAHLLVFWGGALHGFWGFGHNPADYTKTVDIPTLLIYGEQDDRVKRIEIDTIFENLPAKKTLLLLPKAGHANYLEVEKEAWKKGVREFVMDNEG